MSRALTVVARLRRLAVDQARRELAARLSAEAAAAAVEQAAHAAMDNERETARTLPAEAAGGAFAAWLPRGLHAMAQAQDTRVHAEDAAASARVALADARAAGEAVQQMLAREAAALAAATARREQAVLDELGQPRLHVALPSVRPNPSGF